MQNFSIGSFASMDLSKEVASLKALLKEESASRRILEEWINSSLKTTLERHHAELKRISVTYESKIMALEEQLEKEIATRKKLTVWVKDNLGPNLDAGPFKEAVQGVLVRRRAPSIDETSHAPTVSPSSSTKTSTSFKPRAQPVKPKSPRKPGVGKAQGAENEILTDDSEEEQAVTSRDPTRPKVAPSSGKLAKSFASAGVASGPPAANPVLRSRVQKLATIETAVWGEDDVTNATFPVGDATNKTNKNRIEYYLQQQKHSVSYYSSAALLEKTTAFLQKGAKVVFAPLAESDMLRDAFSFAILTHDRLFPICPDGLIRSQIMYLVLQGIKRKLGVSTGVELPHGARSGFDPYLIQDHATDTQQQFHHIQAPSVGREITAFNTAFGVEKVARFGQDSAGTHLISLPLGPKSKVSEAELSEISKHRRRMREYFDLYFYGSFKSTQTASSSSNTHGGRIILLAFGSAVPIVMDRLSEVNYRFDLSKVTLLCLPYPTDRLTASDTKAEDYAAAYKLYASLFTPILE